MDPKDQAETVMVRLRKAGYNVILDSMPPRDWLFTPDGVLLHHTASTSVTSVEQERADVRYLKASTATWPAPRVQWYVGRTGRVYLIAKGGANHAGTGNELAEYGIPANLGNRFLWGIEVQSDGYGMDWTKDQWDATHALVAELCSAMKVTEKRVWRHKDYDNDSGKVDTRYPLQAHRDAVKKYWANKEDEMQAEDFQKIRQIVSEEIDKKVDDIAELAAKKVLSSDLFPKREDIDQTVRAALREAGGKG